MRSLKELKSSMSKNWINLEFSKMCLFEMYSAQVWLCCDLDHGWSVGLYFGYLKVVHVCQT